MVIEHRTAEFKPQFVYIPFVVLDALSDGDVVDPKDCTPLYLDAEIGNDGPLYTKQQWESGEEATIYRNSSRGECDGLGEGDIVSLVPDMAIVKLAEREYWSDEIQARTKEIYGVYAINLREHHHICSITPNYEAKYLCTQFDPIDGLTDAEDEKLNDDIRDGANDNEPFSYFEVDEIDSILENVCREHFHPANGKSGGYKTDTGMIRTEDAYTWAQAYSDQNYI